MRAVLKQPPAQHVVDLLLNGTPPLKTDSFKEAHPCDLAGDCCSTHQSSEDCNAACLRTLKCGHVCPKKCCEDCIPESECQVPKEFDCPEFPQHKRIKSACSSSSKQLLAKCRSRCSRQLPCGHYCSNRCCDPCVTLCEKPCNRKLECEHKCQMKCKEATLTKSLIGSRLDSAVFEALNV